MIGLEKQGLDGRVLRETHADVLLELHVTIRSVFPGVSTGWRMVGPFSIY